MRFAPLSLLGLVSALLTASPSTASAIEPGRTPGIEAAPPGDSIPYLRGIATIPERPIHGDRVQLRFDGVLPYKCGVVSAPFGSPFAIELRPWPHFCSSLFPGPWHWTADMGVLPAGVHRVMYELHVVADPAAPLGDSATVYHGSFEFMVARPDSQPPPPAGPLPYVDAILIQRKPDLIPFERICPDDSIQVTVAGHFPSDCYSLTSIEVLYVRGVPEPGGIRITVDDNGCLGRPCTQGPVPWRGRALLGPRRSGHYELPVVLGEETCGLPHDSVFATRVPFRVDSCETPPPPPGCLTHAWSGRGGSGECDAFISPAQPAKLAFEISTPVPLSGLQGQFALGALPGHQALRITRIDPIGPASSMHLSWVPTAEGARFVLFAQRGAPIPSPDDSPVAILSLTLEVIPGQTAPPQTYLTAFELLGSDVEGRAVEECIARPSFRQTAAVICSGRDCDDNGDGRVDVRDLVLMVRCLQSVPSCDDRARFDCNQDGAFSLDDVICCARRILGRPDCTNCPPDTTPPRKEPQVRLDFGSPRFEGRWISVPMRLEGASRLGAARFALKYPAERYTVASVEFPDAPPTWLTLYEIQDDRVVFGVIQSPFDRGGTAVDLVVRLELEPGQTVGGEVSCGDSEFSGPDGVPLEISIERGALPLVGSGRIALSENRPNPFARTTAFSLTLDRAASVDVGVFDIGGRFVASIQDGPLAAGSHPFTWDGRAADGSVASNGIYFIRALAGGRSVSRRIVLLGAR